MFTMGDPAFDIRTGVTFSTGVGFKSNLFTMDLGILFKHYTTSGYIIYLYMYNNHSHARVASERTHPQLLYLIVNINS